MALGTPWRKPISVWTTLVEGTMMDKVKDQRLHGNLVEDAWDPSWGGRAARRTHLESTKWQEQVQRGPGVQDGDDNGPITVTAQQGQR